MADAFAESRVAPALIVSAAEVVTSTLDVAADAVNASCCKSELPVSTVPALEGTVSTDAEVTNPLDILRGGVAMDMSDVLALAVDFPVSDALEIVLKSL